MDVDPLLIFRAVIATKFRGKHMGNHPCCSLSGMASHGQRATR